MFNDFRIFLSYGIFITVIFLGCVASIQYGEYQKNRHELAMASIERPRLDEMCAAYFEWSMKVNQRVKGMETHCAEKK